MCLNPERTPICTGKAIAAGTPHLGVAVHHRPGHRDTTPQHQAGGQALPSEHRAHDAEKRPHGELKPENLTKRTETNKNGDGATINAVIRRKMVPTAIMWPGSRLWPGCRTWEWPCTVGQALPRPPEYIVQVGGRS